MKFFRAIVGFIDLPFDERTDLADQLRASALQYRQRDRRRGGGIWNLRPSDVADVDHGQVDLAPGPLHGDRLAALAPDQRAPDRRLDADPAAAGVGLVGP